MKTLVLLRHAKTEQPYMGQDDFERELTTAGISDAIHKGKILKSKMEVPQMIISSSSRRTKQTSELVAEQLGYPSKKIIYREELYLCSTRTMLEEINALSDDVSIALVVAHNPGTEYIAEYLSGEAIGHVNTSGAICFEFDVDSWNEVSQNNGSLKWSDFTKSQKK